MRKHWDGILDYKAAKEHLARSDCSSKVRLLPCNTNAVEECMIRMCR